MQIMCDKFPDFVRRSCGSSMRRGVAAGPSAATSSQFVARRRLAAETPPHTGISPCACVVEKTVDARCVFVKSYCILTVFNFFHLTQRLQQNCVELGPRHVRLINFCTCV
jgi:hypothetical protein